VIEVVISNFEKFT